MAPIASQSPVRIVDGAAPPRVRKSLLAALGVSLLLHAVWSLWPVEPSSAPPPEETVLQATLTTMPPPPIVTAQTAPPPPPAATPKPKRVPRKPASPARIVTSESPPAEDVLPPSDARPATNGATTAASAGAAPAVSGTTAQTSDAPAAPAVVLPPRVDLAYRVFLGTRGFLIGDATYRFEHAGDRYRISTIAQASGLAALIVRGTGKVESRGRITPAGLRPYEFAVERGGPDRREVAFFDWDAGNVVLHDGATAQLEAPAFDPLTILWQPYFSPPGRDDQTFSLATTRRVTRYTLSLQGEETIAWPQGEIRTERWHRQSEDGKTEAWIWLAPSMHYIPIKMRIARTMRGTLEVLLDSIRVDDAAVPDMSVAIEVPRANPVWNPPAPNLLPVLPPEDAHGQ
jgi:hypothetical protein